MKDSFKLMVDIATMEVAYFVVRILGIAKYLTIFLFIVFSLLDVPVSRLAVISFGWMALSFVLVLMYKSSFDKYRIILFLLIVSSILSTICFIVYSYKTIYFSKYSYLFIIHIASWLLEKIMAKMGYNHAISCKEDYIKRGIIKNKPINKDE